RRLSSRGLQLRRNTVRDRGGCARAGELRPARCRAGRALHDAAPTPLTTPFPSPALSFSVAPNNQAQRAATIGIRMDVKGRPAVIRGSATGIGGATAELLASKGCNVVINYTRSEKEAKETEAACRKHQVDTLCIQADVSKDEDCRRMADEAAKKWGRL